jgi:hypothetical protein
MPPSILVADNQDLFKGGEADTMSAMLQNDLGSYVQDAISAGAASSAAGLQKVLEIQRDWILNKAAGISENFDYSYGTSSFYTSILPFPTHPDSKPYPVLG